MTVKFSDSQLTIAKLKKCKMKRISFTMKLLPGNELVYQQRHEALWPELQTLLKSAGISNYSISLDRETHLLFARMDIIDQQQLASLANEPVMKKWWQYMKDIMETNEDGSPVTLPLKEVFYLP
jgi:L-rhamnose mutarotase